jgi:hypothetical protein
MADGGSGSVQGEQDRQAVELVAPSGLVGASEIGGRDVHAAPEPVPLPGGAQSADLGLVVAGPPRVARGEEAEMAFGGGPEQRMHWASLRGWRVGPGASRRSVDGARHPRPVPRYGGGYRFAARHPGLHCGTRRVAGV